MEPEGGSATGTATGATRGSTRGLARGPGFERRALLVLLVLSFVLRLALACGDLGPDYAWDERYSIDNVTAILDGSLGPVNGYYPALSYLPQAILLGSLESGCKLWRATPAGPPPEALCRLREGRKLTAAGYFWCRLLSIVFGTLSIWWLARVARRLFGSGATGWRIGLAAAALLAMLPWHVRQSGVFKPDALLVLLVLVTCEATLLVAASPTLRRHLVAGALIGLATVTKYNGLGVAVPLVAVTLLAARRQPKRLARLLAAGLLAMATVALLQLPLLLEPSLLQDFGRTLADYDQKATAADASAAGVALVMAGHLASSRYHHPPFALLALVGLLALGRDAWRAGRERREQLVALLCFPLGYLALYLAVTTNPAEHNWLPMAPFTSLAAAYALCLAAGAAATRWPRTARALPLALVALIAVSASTAGRYVYDDAVASTWEIAERHLLRELPPMLVDRVVVYEPWGEAWPRLRRQRWNRPALVATDSLGDDRARFEETADALLLQVADSPHAYVPPHRRGRLIEPAPWRPGPALRVAVRPWSCTAPRRELAADDGAWTVPDPRPAGRWVSLRVVTRPGVDPALLQGATLAGRPLRLFPAGEEEGGARWVSERVRWEGAPGEARALRLRGLAPPQVLRVVWMAWEPPGGPRGEAECPPEG